MTPATHDELTHAAASAWAALIGPAELPIEVAIDMAQEVTGDRDDAVSALADAAADWLGGLMPPKGRGPGPEANRRKAGAVCGFVRCESYFLAERTRRELHRLTVETRVTRLLRPRVVRQAAADDAAAWGLWCEYARRAIEFAARVSGESVPAGEDSGTEGERP